MARAQLPYAAAGSDASLAGEPPRKGRRTALRVFLGIVLLVAIAAGATVAIVANEVGGLVEAFKKTAAVKVEPKVLAPTYKGGPETLLLVGNDERKPPGKGPEAEVVPHANEMLLIRVDPSKPTISMLSIPRELSVTLTKPNGEVLTGPNGELLTEQRFNAAFTFGWLDSNRSISGGIKLMLETIKKVLGLSVNHVFVVNFKKFEHAIEEMGCLYFPVDRRYYHVNEPGGEQYFPINLKPGYQTLCGEQALEYVANRHESTSLVRDARDQRFILEIKKQYGGNLFEEREKFEHILGKNVETDLKGEGEVLNLLELLVETEGKPVRQVEFPLATIGILDTATEADVHEAVTKFLGGTAKVSKRRVESAVSAVRKKARRKAPLEPSMAPTSEEALNHARSLAPDLPFALEYPRIRNSNSEAEPDELRPYKLQGPHHHRYASYVIVIARGLLGQYYDVEGTTWLHPPILNDPNQEVKIGSRIYSLYYSGEHIVTVAWREGNAVYWIENTLTNNVSPRQMIEIAEETRPLDSGEVRSPLHRAKEAQAALKVVAASSGSSKSREEKIAIAVGGAALIAMLVLLALILLRRRELRILREEIAQTVAVEVRRTQSSSL